MSISVPAKWPTNWTLKTDDWLLLIGTQSTWYLVCGHGYDGTNTNISLVGPDWYGGASSLTAVSISGVTGVYSTTVQFN